MEQKTFIHVLEQAQEKGEKYRVSNERLEDAAAKLETCIIDLLKEAEFVSRISVQVGDTKYIVIPKKDTVFVCANSCDYNNDDVVLLNEGEGLLRVITYYGQNSKYVGIRKTRLQFIKDGTEIIEKLGNHLEKRSNEIEDEIENTILSSVK